MQACMGEAPILLTDSMQASVTKSIKKFSHIILFKHTVIQGPS